MSGHESTKPQKRSHFGGHFISCFRVFVASAIIAGFAAPALAGDRYALLVTGAGGGSQYALKYRAWRQAFQDLLVQRLGYAQDHIVSLAEEQGPGVKSATRDNVRAALIDVRR